MKILFPKKSLIICLFLIASSALILTGCATLFSSRNQKVTIQSTTPDATIKIKEQSASTAKNVTKAKFDKMMIFNTVLVQKEGYKSTHYSFQLNKRSPTFAFAILDLFVPIYGWFYGIPIDIVSPKTRKYDKVQKVPALISYQKRKGNEKYMLINKTAFDAKGADIIWHYYSSINRFNGGNQKDPRSVKKHNKSKDREDIKVDNTIFTDGLNMTLKKMNFIDTTNAIFPDINNSLFLNATVKKLTFHYLRSNYAKLSKRSSSYYKPNNLLSVELYIDWEVLDYYKQKISDARTIKKSDLFTIPFNCSDKEFMEKLTDAIRDNLEYALIDLRKELSDKGTLNISNNKAKLDTLSTLYFARPTQTPGSRINDFMKSVATVKVDDGHGSGVVISADGYLMTAYHVVAGTKKIEVVFNDGSKADAEVVRTNPEADLALIKVNRTGFTPLLLSEIKDPEIGVDVWAIGTPKSIELGQSVSKGILSGLRKANDVNYLQTDVSINHGNSGGALINKEGTVLGIVTSKLVGIGTEGVGFAISSQEIFARLKVSYK